MMHRTVALGACLWFAAGTVLAEESGMTALDLQTTAKVLNYELVRDRQSELPKPNPDFWGARTVPEKLEDLQLTTAARAITRPRIEDEDRRQPYRHFMPSLSGATGLIDIPTAYTIPRKKWVVSAQTERVVADIDYWFGPYRRFSVSNQYYSINYGATRNIEVNADLEFQTKDFRYADWVNGTNPRFRQDDEFYLGFGSKWAFPMPHEGLERVWFATGFRVQFYENPDRNVMEIHEYERMQNIYFVFSAKGTQELFGHLMFKYISYDWKGGTYPSGRTESPFFPGYSPVNAWMQWGLAFEWFVFPDLNLFTELHKDTNVIFFDNLLQFNWNVGLRYQYKDLGIGFYAKRINFKGLDDNGIQASWKF